MCYRCSPIGTKKYNPSACYFTSTHHNANVPCSAYVHDFVGITCSYYSSYVSDRLWPGFRHLMLKCRNLKTAACVFSRLPVPDREKVSAPDTPLMERAWVCQSLRAAQSCRGLLHELIWMKTEKTDIARKLAIYGTGMTDKRTESVRMNAHY